ASALLREGKHVPREVLVRCSTLGELLSEIGSLSDESAAASLGNPARLLETSHKRSSRKPQEEHAAWGMMWSSPCRWILHRDRPLDKAVFRRAIEELIQRHRLHTAPVDPMEMFSSIQKALSLLHLWRLKAATGQIHRWR
ncbi:unnamed protein product, partial [Polarella glacialis]